MRMNRVGGPFDQIVFPSTNNAQTTLNLTQTVLNNTKGNLMDLSSEDYLGNNVEI